MRFAPLSLVPVLLLLLRWEQPFTEAMINPVDFLALQAIRKSLDDLPGSNFFDSWDFTGDPCSFAGVYCDGDNVTALNLGDPRAGSPGLSGRIDPAIGKLYALTELTIVPGRIIVNRVGSSVNRILTGAIQFDSVSQSFKRFASSVLLSDANQNRSQTQQPHRCSFSHVSPPSLQYLSLGWNQLTGPVNQVLLRLNQLSYLDLSLNRFTGAIPGQIFAFPITNLQLQRNFFYGAVQPANQVTIATVDLSFNRFSGEISPLLSSVQNLYLNNNRFTGQVPVTFVDRLLASGIQTLYLQHNFLTGIQISPAADIPVSSSLCLQYNCMVPPVQTPCPVKAGPQKTRPTTQCNEWRG
ncbi:hypothetical protein Bca52824_001990 [Brassica carinata]|uniref:Leucine-rich repeat-containing N-terminal plant-type domain-containing protein n=1 Tax=Brassica carinata TaxID=52824 RepID=A0A8X7WL78_BRACI|nr:hypothetical protein Bca52824_001990 [Brassica carinata]